MKRASSSCRALIVLLLVVGLCGCDKSKKPSTPAATSTADLTNSDSPEKTAPVRMNDTHTHLNPFAYSVFVPQMDAIGLRRIVNMSGGSSAESRREHLAVADRYDGRVALFHNVDWEHVADDDFGARQAEALRRSVRIGFAGLKISKALGLGVKIDDQLVPVDDERLDPLWDAAGDLGVPVGIHTSDPRAFFEPPTPDNERWAELSLAPGWSFYGDEFPSRDELLAQRDRMIEKHPETTFILLHLANNPEDLDYVDKLMKTHDNVYVDIAARVGEFGRHPSDKVRDFFIRHQDRVFFATDLMLSLYPDRGGRMGYRLTLGSISEEEKTLEDIPPFYAKHREYFEGNAEAIDHPVPIQGDWKVHPIDLPEEVLQKLYWKNSERVVFAPWLGRRRAHEVIRAATGESFSRSPRR